MMRGQLSRRFENHMRPADQAMSIMHMHLLPPDYYTRDDDLLGARIDQAILWMRQFANNDAVAQLGLQINLSLAHISCKYKRKEKHLCACTKRRGGCYILYGQAHEKAEITQDPTQAAGVAGAAAAGVGGEGRRGH